MTGGLLQLDWVGRGGGQATLLLSGLPPCISPQEEVPNPLQVLVETEARGWVGFRGRVIAGGQCDLETYEQLNSGRGGPVEVGGHAVARGSYTSSGVPGVGATTHRPDTPPRATLLSIWEFHGVGVVDSAVAAAGTSCVHSALGVLMAPLEDA